jgi:hypothetical protein
VRLGLMPRLDNALELEAWLAPRLLRKKQQPRSIRQFSFAAPEAAERILGLALNY